MLLDGVTVGVVQYGPVDQAAEGTMPDGSSGTQYVFHISLALRREEAHRICCCVISVRSQENDEYEETFELAVDPANAMPVTVTAGRTHSSLTYAHVRPPVVLYVERAAQDDSGQLLVHGWAVSLTAMVTVLVFLDEERIGAAQLGGQRDDVGNAFPVYRRIKC